MPEEQGEEDFDGGTLTSVSSPWFLVEESSSIESQHSKEEIQKN
jgi:hypothetical protein